MPSAQNLPEAAVNEENGQHLVRKHFIMHVNDYENVSNSISCITEYIFVISKLVFFKQTCQTLSHYIYLLSH